MKIHNYVAEDEEVFKVPSLFNIALTGPYMHDGRFESLDEVIDLYNEGVQSHPNLNEQLKDSHGNPKRLDLDQTEKDALIAFLHTLTDISELGQMKFSDPWK